ncbi:hypothetical protein [Saccharomonospora iraqiensis]|nr:hypothetical protein [Saccharomonospora iraqiensis]
MMATLLPGLPTHAAQEQADSGVTTAAATESEALTAARKHWRPIRTAP